MSRPTGQTGPILIAFCITLFLCYFVSSVSQRSSINLVQCLLLGFYFSFELVILWKFLQMARSALDELTESGAFNRSPSTFRNFISKEKTAQFPAESGRYHLYISYACPWASRCLSYLKLKGLDKAIGFTVTLFTLTPFSPSHTLF